MKRIRSTEMVSHGSTAAYKDVNRYRHVRQWKTEIPELDRALQVNEISNRGTRRADYVYRPSIFRALFVRALDWVESDRNFVMGGIGIALIAIVGFVALYLGAFDGLAEFFVR